MQVATKEEHRAGKLLPAIHATSRGTQWKPLATCRPAGFRLDTHLRSRLAPWRISGLPGSRSQSEKAEDKRHQSLNETPHRGGCEPVRRHSSGAATVRSKRR